MRKIIAFLTIMPTLLYAQITTNDSGIHFQHGLSWEQVKIKAKAENKFIFLDCYATWCGPCKWMDLNVYPKDSIGQYMNERFISVKMQMDSSKNDNEEIKSWYASSKKIKNEFEVNAFPTFLFFNHNG